MSHNDPKKNWNQQSNFGQAVQRTVRSNQEVSHQSHVQMRFDVNKKSMLVSYVLWFFLGTLGGHRFYNNRGLSAIIMLVLTIIGWISLLVFVGFIFLAFVWIWVIVDAFLIPNWVTKYNNDLVDHLTDSSREY